MESLMIAIYWAIAAIMVRYLITQPHHVRALLNIFCFYCFAQSIIYYSDATDIEISSSAIVVLTFITFFATVTHSPLTWLSLILYADPSKLPVSEIPRPISEWFARPRQLIPPDSRSQAPDAINAEANKSQWIENLKKELKDAKSLILTYVRYVAMYEESQLSIRELENEVQALKEDVKAREEDAVYARAERDLFKKKSDSDKARADKCDTIILGLMEKRDQRIRSRVCRWCKPTVRRLRRDIKDMGKKLYDTAGAHNDLVTSTVEAEKDKDKIIDEMDKIIADKDKVIADKDTIIADKDKIISAKGDEALAKTASADLGDSSQASLFAHIGAMELQLRDRDAEVARLNGQIDARRFCCCGGCGGTSPGGPSDDGNDGGDDGTGNTNGGSPQGGNAQPPTAASEPSGAPPCPVGEPSNPPPTAGEPSDDDDAGPVPSAPSTAVSSPLSSLPASPASDPAALVPLPTSPVPVPATLIPLPGSPISDPATLVPLPASPASIPSSPTPVPAALVPLPTSPVASPARLVFAPAAPGFGPASSTFGVPPASGPEACRQPPNPQPAAQQPPTTPGPNVPAPPVPEPPVSGLPLSGPPILCPAGLPPQQPVPPVADNQPYVYVPRFSTQLTAPELSTLLKFYSHANAPKPRPRPQPSQPYVYVPRFSTKLSARELSTILTFYTHPNTPKRRFSPQPCQPYVYVRRYSPEYTDSEKSALWAFSSQRHAYISRYSASEQSALNAFSSQPHAWIPRSFASEQSTLDAFASRCSAARAYSPQAPDLQFPFSTVVPDPAQPAATMSTDAMDLEVIPQPSPVPDTTQELITPATVVVAPNESIQSADPSQFGAAKAIPPRPKPLKAIPPRPQPLKRQPAEDAVVNAPLENIPPPSAHEGAAGITPTNAMSAPPSVPVPALAPPVIDDDEDDDDDDNNLLKAHRRVRAKRSILVGGPMKWIPEEVAYGLKEALKDLKEANRKAKRRLLSRKKPISTAAIVKFTKNFEGFMPGDWTNRPKAKRAWINDYMQRVLDKACGRRPTIANPPAAPSSKEQSDPSASGDKDGAAKTAEVVANDDDDLLPAGWAMGEDEVGGDLSDFVAPPADIYSTTDAPASTLDSMMTKMSIGTGSSHIGSSLPAPAPQVAVN